MPYVTKLFRDYVRVEHTTGKSSCVLNAETDDDAVVEADKWLRASRVVASVHGDDPPSAGIVLKDGQEFACLWLRPEPER